MKVAKSGEIYLMRLDPGDDILETIQQWSHGQKIVNAHITGIGSVEDPTLAHYRRDHKQFSERKMNGIYEVTSLIGNIGLIDGEEPLVHIHVSLADSLMQAFGGHLVKGVCSGTTELVLTPLASEFRKNFDENIGLKVWDFDS